MSFTDYLTFAVANIDADLPDALLPTTILTALLWLPTCRPMRLASGSDLRRFHRAITAFSFFLQKNPHSLA